MRRDFSSALVNRYAGLLTVVLSSFVLFFGGCSSKHDDEVEMQAQSVYHGDDQGDFRHDRESHGPGLDDFSNSDGSFNVLNEGDDLFCLLAPINAAASYKVFSAKAVNGPWSLVISLGPTPLLAGATSPEQGHRSAVFFLPSSDHPIFYRAVAADSVGRTLFSYPPVMVLPLHKETRSEHTSFFFPNAPPVTEQSSPSLRLAAPLAAPPSVCGNNCIQNSPLLSNQEFTNKDALSLAQIRAILAVNRSFLSGDGGPGRGIGPTRFEIYDVDHVRIDPGQLIFQSAQANGINPKVLLATLQKESHAITTSRRPRDLVLRSLAGAAILPGAAVPPFTVRGQIAAMGRYLKSYLVAALADEPTPGEWFVGSESETEDGVNVCPANAASVALWQYTPFAGKDWGGQVPGGESLFFSVYYGPRFHFGTAPTVCGVYNDFTGLGPTGSITTAKPVLTGRISTANNCATRFFFVVDEGADRAGDLDGQERIPVPDGNFSGGTGDVTAAVSESLSFGTHTGRLHVKSTACGATGYSQSFEFTVEDAGGEGGAAGEGGGGGASGRGGAGGSGPPPAGGATGYGSADPHLRTFDGVRYDCQPKGEEIFVASSSGDLEVQVRTQPFAGQNVAVIVATAVRVAGDRLAFYLDGSTTLNGTPTAFGGGLTQLEGGGQLWRLPDSYVVVWSDGSQLRLTSTGIFMGVQVSLAPSRAGQVAGLLGNANGTGADDLVTRDGKTKFSTPVSFADFYGQYVESWRVTQAGSLFDYASGETTETFTDRSFPHLLQSVRTLSSAQVQSATAICQASGVTSDWLDACVLDVALSNGDVRFAAALAEGPAVTSSADIDAPIQSGVCGGSACSPGAVCNYELSAVAGEGQGCTIACAQGPIESVSVTYADNCSPIACPGAASKCLGAASCAVAVSNSICGNDPCVGTPKSAMISLTCAG